jgi:hypothetical protein
MKKYKRPRLQRRPIFLGCEGESEQSYGKLLDQLINDYRDDLHIQSHLLTGTGGNPLMLVNLANAQIQRNESINNSPYLARALLLDYDTSIKLQSQNIKAERAAQAADLILIWQDPCHEAFLLLHTHKKRRPNSSKEANNQLCKLWPNYEKGMTTRQLRKNITIANVMAAAKACEGLSKLLRILDLPKSIN